MSLEKQITPWLRKIGLERYAEAFAAEDVDLEALRLLTDADLRELGVTLGHRKRILQQIARESAPAGPPPPTSASNTAAASGSQDAAERRFVSVLFCDMAGSTELARKVDPEDLRLLLRSYQDRVAHAVGRYGGHVAQYLGDGVMAFFGWPKAFEDQAERAIRAGLDAIAAVASLDSGGFGAIGCRAAVASGEVVIGDLSEAGRQEGAIAGETPNLAARLQRVAESGQLVVSEATRPLIGGVFDVVAQGKHALKGFGEPTPVYRVTGLKNLESRFDAMRGTNLSRFVGRQSELAFVLEKWQLAKSGAGQAILLSGVAGIGKSRLMRALADALAGEPMQRWHLHCSPYHASSALYPVIQSLLRTLEIGPTTSAEMRLDRLEHLLAGWGADVAEAAPIFADLLSFDATTRYAPLALAPQALKDAIFTTLMRQCHALARRSPLMIVIEDAHWIDPTTLELAERTIASIVGAPILIVATHRPGWQTDLASRHDHVTTLSLGRLSPSQTVELVRELVGPEATDELVDDVATRTGGVPMFIEEIARSVIEAGLQEAGTLTVPATLQGALAARLDGLSPVEKELVQIACVFGREFQSSLIAGISGREPAEVSDVLAGLCRRGIAARSGTESGAYSFRHALIQDTAYQSLLRARRRQLHNAIATAIETDRPDIAEAQPELLARHLSEAQLGEKALPLWHRAGQRALARHANEEAIQHFSRAIEVARRLADVAERKRATLVAEVAFAEALLVAGRASAAMEAFRHAAATAREQSDRRTLVACALGFDEAQFLSNEPLNPSIETLEEALGVLDEGDQLEQCRLSCRLTRAYAMLGEAERADQFGRTTIDLARRLGEERLLVEVMLHGLLMPSGGLSPAQMQSRLQQADEFLAQVRASDDLADHAYAKLVGRTMGLQVHQAAEFGERRRMDERLRELELWCTERDDLHLIWVSRHGKAMQAILDGDFAAAETLAEEALAMGRRIHDEQVDGVYGMQMFTIRREQGRLSEVARVVKRLVDDDPGLSAWRPGFALIASDLGHADAARRIFLELAETGFALPLDGKRSTTLAYLAEVCTALGDEQRAETLYRLLAPYAHMTIATGVTTVCYGAAGRFLALLAGTMGDLRLAEEHFQTALEINTRMSARPWLAHTQCDLAQLLRLRDGPRDRKRAEVLAEASAKAGMALGMRSLMAKLQQPQ